MIKERPEIINVSMKKMANLSFENLFSISGYFKTQNQSACSSWRSG